jgi:hypothetical protein
MSKFVKLVQARMRASGENWQKAKEWVRSRAPQNQSVAFASPHNSLAVTERSLTPFPDSSPASFVTAAPSARGVDRLSLAEHLELKSECDWYQPCIWDVAEVLWNTYGVSSDVGRLAERIGHETQNMVALIEDEVYRDRHSIEAFRAPLPAKLPNRFGIVPGAIRRLPGRMSMTLHEQVGSALKRASGFFDQASSRYGAREIGADFAKKGSALHRLRQRMALRLEVDVPGAPATTYLLDGETQVVGRPKAASKTEEDVPCTPDGLEEARQIVRALLDRDEDLRLHGVFLPQLVNLQPQDSREAKVEKRKSEHKAQRTEMLNEAAIGAFIACCKWLDGAARTKAPNKTISSYGAKHVVEGLTGLYIPNGVFIAAAMYKRFEMKRDYPSPNVTLGIGKRWYDEQFDRMRVATSVAYQPSA